MQPQKLGERRGSLAVGTGINLVDNLTKLLFFFLFSKKKKVAVFIIIIIIIRNWYHYLLLVRLLLGHPKNLINLLKWIKSRIFEFISS